MNNIAFFRKKLNLTVDELAKRTGIKSTDLSNLEIDKKRINWDILVTIAKALNCKPEDLIRVTPNNNLKILRIKKGITIRELGSLTDIRISALSDIENGKLRLNEDNIQVIAKALDCNVDDLINPNLDVNMVDIKSFNENIKININSSWLKEQYNLTPEDIVLKDIKDTKKDSKILFAVIKKD